MAPMAAESVRCCAASCCACERLEAVGVREWLLVEADDAVVMVVQIARRSAAYKPTYQVRSRACMSVPFRP